ncbi:MAG: thioesterase family protein [Chitinophagaceae bacterium]
MERIKIALPEAFSFSTNIPVRITDINYGNHVGNDTFMSLMHEARMQFFGQFGYTELQFEGVGLIMAYAAIEFKQEIIYGDTVMVQVTAAGFDKLGFDIFYKMTVVKFETEVVVGKAKTGMICYDYSLKKKVAIPIKALLRIHGENNRS